MPLFRSHGIRSHEDKHHNKEALLGAPRRSKAWMQPLPYEDPSWPLFVEFRPGKENPFFEIVFGLFLWHSALSSGNAELTRVIDSCKKV